MLCPNDNTTLMMSDKNGVEIDYCPECRGVWLDRGELDKIIEKADSYSSPHDRRTRDNQENEDERGGFLSDLFGFGD